MFTVDVPTQQFTAINNTDVNTLNAGYAYLLFVRGDRSINLGNDASVGSTVLRASGTLHVGPQTQNFSAANPTPDGYHFAMFGNPYQSAVNVNTVFANSTNVNTAHYYVYDPTLGDHGAYVTVNLPAGGATGGSDANQYLQPGQAAQFVSINNNASSIVFAETDKAPGQHTSSSATGNGLSADDILTVLLYTTDNFSNGGKAHDGFTMIFANGNDNGITPVDAVKPMNFYENLGIDNNGTYLSIEHREMPQSAEVYPLFSSGYKHSAYTLELTIDGLQDSFLYLDDHFTGTSTLLEVGANTYAFNVDAGDANSMATDRFSIRTAQRLGVDGNNLLSGIRLYPNPVDGNTFYINAPGLDGEKLGVSVNDLSGRRIFDRTLECRANTVTVPLGDNVSSGVYMVTLKHGGEIQTYRLIKE